MILNTDTDRCNAEHQREDFVKVLIFKFRVCLYIMRFLALPIA